VKSEKCLFTRFLVPKPLLGNALAEKPRLLVSNQKQLEAGASSTDEFPSRGLGTRETQTRRRIYHV